MNQIQVDEMEHALRNGNRFYSDFNDSIWNELVEKGYATKHPGWDKDSAYYRVTSEGKKALELTSNQIGKLKHCFGLDYSSKPYRNYYHCNALDKEWEDMIAKGYANRKICENGVYYYGTLKGLRKVFRRNVSAKYYEKL